MNFSRFLDIQSWWEVSSIAYFCSLFRTAFNLLDFDIEELEEALLTDGTEECASSLLTELIVRLLNGCLGNNGISTFNYQKYNSKSDRRPAADYVSPDSRYSPIRSPNGNVAVHSHSHTSHTSHSTHAHLGHHHYSHCSDERAYSSTRNSYLQKGSEKERDRDYKTSRDKYKDSVRSPKDKRCKDSERSNHERTDNTDIKKSRTSGGLNVSASTSSKYNKRSAPSSSVPSGGSEWSEHISSSGKKYYYNCISEVSQWEKPREWDSRRTSSKDSSYSSRNNHEKRPSAHTVRETEKPSKRPNNASDRYWNSNSVRSSNDDGHLDRSRTKHSSDGHSLQDMDISPDRSTPLSENSYEIREPNTSTRNNTENNTVPPVVVLDNSNQQSGSLLAAALPRIVAPPPMATGNGAPGGIPSVMSPMGDTCATATSGTGSTGTPHRDAGPPTPTHSENIDPHAPPLHLETALPRKMECLGSYSSVVGNAALNQAPMLTLSLVNHVRADLTGHVTGWPADLLEKQANKFTEEAYQLGCLQCTKVSSELKCSRSLVRHTEIQAILQEQKIMYLRQQLEELKSQNSFMSEDM